MVAASTKTPSENTTILEADQFLIKTVKLSQSSGNAQITRTFPLSFLRSQDEPRAVEIVHLPASIQSVDVSVKSTSGNVMILDHYHTSITKLQNSTPSSQTLHELEKERLRIVDEKRIRQQSFTFLTTYMDSLAQCKSHGQPEAAQMVTFFDEFVEIGVDRSAAIADLDAKLADVGIRITEETDRLSRLSSNLPVKVVAVLSCSGRDPVEDVELTVTYGRKTVDFLDYPLDMTVFQVVKQVSWKPAYDLHIAMTGNTPSQTVTLHFRCAVTQWTGENWENVSLALTTADQASQLIQLPEPKNINISLGPTSVFSFPYPPRAVSFGQATQSRQIWHEGMEHDCNYDRERTVAEQHAVVPVAEMASVSQVPPPVHVTEVPEADAPSQLVSQLVSHDSKDPITHIANGSMFIPSDHAAHHILVASLSLPAEFMRVVVPSVDTRVYYTCEVKNTSKYVLLPGTVKVCLNDNHVSSTEIPNTELPQTLECSLAVDTDIKTMHSRAPDVLPSVAPLTGKATTTYTSATVLHNTHAEPIRGVIVRSSIPLPADPRITVVLKEPAGLAKIDEGSVSVKEGCLARWSTTSGRKGKQAGLFEWVVDMNPGTEVLKAVWEVCVPQDMNLLEQAGS